MDLTERDDALYAAFKAKDTRFDGRFFVGISSTGVYCRPVCRARQAKRSSCTFFPPPPKRNRRATGPACCAARSWPREILW